MRKANPYKFQAIDIGPNTNKHNLSFDLKGNKITCEENVKLFLENQSIKFMLSFSRVLTTAFILISQ
jgi:hypothetical protein